MRVDSIKACPTWACTASNANPSSRSRVRQVWLMAGLLGQPRPLAGAVENLVQPGR